MSRIHSPVLLFDDVERFILLNGKRFTDSESIYYIGTVNDQVVLHMVHLGELTGTSIFLDPTIEHQQVVQAAINLLIEGMATKTINWEDYGNHVAISDYVVMTHFSPIKERSVTLTASDLDLDAIPDTITLPPSKNSLEALSELLETMHLFKETL